MMVVEDAGVAVGSVGRTGGADDTFSDVVADGRAGAQQGLRYLSPSGKR